MKPHPGMSRIQESHPSTERLEKRKLDHEHCISVKGVINVLLLITLILLFAHLVTFFIVHYDSSGSGFVRHLDVYFNLNHENNFPSFFASLIMLFSSLLLWVIYKLTETTDKYRRHWLLLAAVFLFLSLDEALKIHERLDMATKLIFTNNLRGFLSWTWIIPYTLLFLAVAIYNLGFVMQLPRSIRNKFIIAGVIFVLAAAGIESVEGHLMLVTAEDPVVLMITTTVQELAEMISIILFISGLLDYLSATFTNIKVRLV